MRTLNEQIQRLRDVLVTCYNAIERKGGNIPEAGERNMTNLPAAVLSIPQTHGVLTDLEVTTNGVYVPEEGADGFSKVTAKFDTSSLGKVRLQSLRVNNLLLDENGYWAADLVDVSTLTSLREAFYLCSELRTLDVSNWNVSNVTDMQYAFATCSQLQNLDVSQWDTNNVINMASMFASCEQLQQFNGNNWDVRKVLNMGSMFINNKQILHLDLNNWNVDNVQIMTSMFANCNQLQLVEVGNWQTKSVTNTATMFRYDGSLQQLDLTNWDFSNVTNINEMFFGCGALQSIVGGRTYQDVVNNNIGCFNGLEINVGVYTFYTAPLDTASLRAIINGIADVTDQPAESRPTLALGTTLLAKLTDGDKGIATEKGWNLA